MSRSGYSDDCENLGLWRGAVERAIRGKRGQAFLREMAAALDAMPVKVLVAGDIVRDSEHVCALGSVAVARKLDVSTIAADDGESVARKFGVATALAREVAYENDEGTGWHGRETDAERWTRMRAWVEAHLAKTGAKTLDEVFFTNRP